MLDRNSFMETLRSVAEIRRTSTEPLSKEEVLKYFEGMELTEEQYEGFCRMNDSFMCKKKGV